MRGSRCELTAPRFGPSSSKERFEAFANVCKELVGNAAHVLLTSETASVPELTLAAVGPTSLPGYFLLGMNLEEIG